MPTRVTRLLLGIGLAALVFSCTDSRKLGPLNPCTILGVDIKVRVHAVENVDLLFMVDNSNSMAEEQRALRAEFPRIVQSLLLGDPDFDPSAEPYVDPNPANNSAPVRSLRIGVVSSDLGVMGVGENPGEAIIGTCHSAGNPSRARYGDDGLLHVAVHPNSGADGLVGTADDVSCIVETGQTLATLPAFLTFPNEAAPNLTSEQIGQRMSCFASLGTTGCGFEQQLESVLKAATPASSPTRFYAHASEPARALGQAGTGPNGGWFRANSILAIVMVTDEDDCSGADRRLFDYLDCTFPDPLNQRCSNPQAPVYTGLQSNTRCQRFPQLLQPIARYVDGIASLRPDDPQSIVFAGIVGIPTALVDQVDDQMNPAPDEGVSNFAAILSDPAMAETLQNNAIDVAPACSRCPDYNEDGLCNPNEIQRAVPARRIVQVAEGLAARGAGVVVQSICQESFAGATRAILEKIAQAIRSACLPGPMNRNAKHLVDCEVVETLPADARCSDQVNAGRDPSPVRREQGREVCRIRQLPVDAATLTVGTPPTGTGWYYDDFTADLEPACGASGQRVAFTDDAMPTAGSTLRLECIQVTQSGDLAVDVSTPCGPGRASPDCHVTRAQYEVLSNRYGLYQDYDIAFPLFCEYDTNTCQIACDTNADCPGGFVCFDDPDDVDALQGEHIRHCVNPTCGAAFFR